jgi:hypothetical protein
MLHLFDIATFIMYELLRCWGFIGSQNKCVGGDNHDYFFVEDMVFGVARLKSKMSIGGSV